MPTPPTPVVVSRGTCDGDWRIHIVVLADLTGYRFEVYDELGAVHIRGVRPTYAAALTEARRWL
jgi:hypothetical protein